MSWSNNQKCRIKREKEILAKYFPGRVQWSCNYGQTKVQIRMTSNSNKNYTLSITLSEDFPHACPVLLVESPSRLLTRENLPLPTNSRAFHTMENASGFVSICHFVPQFWTNENTLYQVFMKGRLWIEAYEGYLSTGRYMEYFLSHQNH